MTTERLLLARLDLPRPGIAEDAPALAMERAGVGLIGVFDGLGGAGARQVEGEDGRRSSAYYAARLARAAVADRFAAGGITRDEVPAVLSGAIGETLAQRREAAPPLAGAVRSSLFRSYPTTAALLQIEPVRGYVDALAMWAGDSRCYALTPAAGLRQLSVDDSPAGADPMRALRDDPRMTNLLSGDAPAQLNGVVRRIALPALLLVATDGSHACLPSPMHFELMLLDALASACDCDAWTSCLAASLAPRADDDASLAAAFVGWPAFDAAAGSFRSRRTRLRALLDAPLAQAWEFYRADYMALAGVR